jgi:predicted RNA binding protein YcfA (HicA-like mRNA interferase family)
MNARRLPSVTARDVIRALLGAGFSIVRTTGSHYRPVHDADPTRQTTVPVHKGKDIPRGTFRDIIKQAGFSVEEFIDPL